MSRMSRPRAVVATGLTLGTAAAGLFFAPAASAADPTVTPVETDWTVTGPSSVVAGQTFTLEGTDCLYQTEGAGGDVDTYPATVGIFTDSLSEDPADFVFEAAPDAAGDWSASVFFPADTPAGEHVIDVSCIKSYNGGTEERDEYYQYFKLTVTAPGTAAPAPTTPAPSVVGSTDPAANTAGTGSKTGAATATPGAKITKVFTGFQPFEEVTLVLHSDPVVLGTFTADADGVVTAEFTLPAGTAVGTHHLVLDGNMGTHYSETIVVAAGTTTASSGSLAYTGANVGLPLALGAGLLVAGGGALVVTRRRASGTTQA
jgi:hypothetical protein